VLSCSLSSCWAIFSQTMYLDPKTDLYRMGFFPLSFSLGMSSIWSIPISKSIRPRKDCKDSRSLATVGDVFLALERSIVTASNVILSTP
jgi:hypothetical protein